MSEVLIRKALEDRLASLPGGLGDAATAYENAAYTPQAGQPYQRANLLPATPDNAIQGAASYLDVGVFQITLLYPLGAGTGDAALMAEALRQHFRRGTTLTEGELSVLVTHTPHVARGYPDGDRWTVPVSVRYQCQVRTP
ncbi:MAG: DUF4128 domain-containing protein [Ramlibacter sp.]